LLERYEAAGVDGVLVMYPGHTYVHEDGLRSYYERNADATDLGVVLYKLGPRLSLANVAALSERENVLCLKFAQNDVDLFDFDDSGGVNIVDVATLLDEI
jgi:4-hydroxy-tetrahydrodipicolinate synthase